jgi:hypothetical protein
MNSNYNLNKFKNNIKTIFGREPSNSSKNKNNSESIYKYYLYKRKNNGSLEQTIIIELNKTHNTILLKYYMIDNGYYEVKKIVTLEVFNNIKKYLDDKTTANNKLRDNRIEKNRIEKNRIAKIKREKNEIEKKETTNETKINN